MNVIQYQSLKEPMYGAFLGHGQTEKGLDVEAYLDRFCGRLILVVDRETAYGVSLTDLISATLESALKKQLKEFRSSHPDWSAPTVIVSDLLSSTVSRGAVTGKE